MLFLVPYLSLLLPVSILSQPLAGNLTSLTSSPLRHPPNVLVMPENISLLNLTTSYPIHCYPRRSRAFRITNVADCGVSIREMLGEGTRAVDPIQWGPIVDRSLFWGLGSCGLFLIPNSRRSFDTFSRLKLAEEATRLVTGCATEAYGYKGGNVRIGPKGVFDVAVMGRPSEKQLLVEEKRNLKMRA